MQMRKLVFFLAFLAAVGFAITPATSSAQVSVGLSVHIGPPALPVYVQPPCPEPGYMWTPGYWAYGPDGYYWVPGAWVAPPAVGVLWTPGYWGWGGGVYVWHPGYWGPHVGFYGGINYGFGYGGVGFVGGYWRGGGFFYNRAVTNVNVTVIRNVYVNNTVINRTTVVNRVSFNGGPGGVHAQPTVLERRYAGERHFQPTGLQLQHEHLAGANRSLLASANHGRPPIAATTRAGEFSRGVVASRQVNTNYRGNNTVNRGNNSGAGRSNPSFNANNSRNRGSSITQGRRDDSVASRNHDASPRGSSRQGEHERER